MYQTKMNLEHEDIESSLGWTPEELAAIMNQFKEKAKELIKIFSEAKTEEQFKVLRDQHLFINWASSHATNAEQLIYMGIQVCETLNYVEKVVNSERRMEQMKELFGELGKLALGKNEEETESPSIAPGPAKTE